MKWLLVLLCLLALLPMEAEAKTEPMSQEQLETYFAAESLEYYAYMILEDAPEELKPVILEARKQIIHNYDWVADDLDGWVLDPEGNVVETLPHFHEIFPEDWEIPTVD